MNIKKEYLTVWYGFDGPSNKPYITRRSSAQKHKNISDVCDYQLYPILEKDADMLLFNTVWDIVIHSNFYNFYNDIDVINTSLKFEIKGCDIAYARPLLFFPKDMPRLKFSEKEFIYPYFVGVFYEMGDYYAGEAGLIEDGDGCPLFRAYFVPQWDFTCDEPEVVYREYHSKYDEESISKAMIPSNSLQKAVCHLLEFLDDVSVDVGNWKERLTITLEMIKTHANELHILHNVGLYDINALWTLLYQSNQNKVELRRLIRETERELHRYAMMVVNQIDWNYGGVLDEKSFNKSLLHKEPLYSELEEDNPKPSYHKLEVNDYSEQPFVEGNLPEYWWNDFGAMEKAFEWTDEERAALDEAYRQGTYGRDRFCDDLGAYSELLRKLVRQRLNEKKIKKEI